MKNWLIVFLLTCLFSRQGESQEVFENLTGGWVTDAFGGELYSFWEQDGRGGYLGRGIFIEGGDTTYREEIRLSKIEDKWILLAVPENSDPFVFEAKKIGPSEIHFENDRLQNPKKVLYRFENDGTFYRLTQGRNEDGSPARNEYFFKKMKGVETAPGFNIPGKLSVSDKAEILAPNVLSSELPEFATAVSPDGKLLLFNRTEADHSRMYLMFSQWENGNWSEPERVSFSDGTYRDVDPSFTPDGRYLFFSSNRPLKNRKSGDFNIWVCQMNGTEFGKPQALTQNVNSEDVEIFSSLTQEGHLYFSRTGEKRRVVIRCELKDKRYQPGEIVDLNTGEASIGNPMVSPDETFIIFNSDEMEGYGESDLYISWKKVSTWSLPKNMGSEINSVYAEFAPSISPDGKYLYFTSERPGMVQVHEEEIRRPSDLYQIYLPPLLDKLKSE